MKFSELIKAIEDGKTIQSSNRKFNEQVEWTDCFTARMWSIQDFNGYIESFDFRIKPELRVFKVAICKRDNRVVDLSRGNHKAHCLARPDDYEIITVTENPSCS